MGGGRRLDGRDVDVRCWGVVRGGRRRGIGFELWGWMGSEG